MKVVNRVLRFFIIVTILHSLAPLGRTEVFAQAEQEPPERQTTIVVPVTEHEWWLIRWADNFIVCQVVVDHEGVPTNEEISKQCSSEVYEEWSTTPPCSKAEKAGKDQSSCSGLYLFLAQVRSGDKEVVIDLPLPTVWVTLSGCNPVPPENICTNIPALHLAGEEPLPNEQITAIHAVIDDQLITCEGSTCDIPLNPTPLRGEQIEFWAESSFGDTSEHFTALVRVLDRGVQNVPGRTGWYVDVLSSQWQGGKIESCAEVWQAFPPVGLPPSWLSTPNQQVFLASDQPYHYLAGRLISQGLVDASDCPDNGLLDNGYANACGLNKARPMVTLWQNQFDPLILDAAEQLGLPAQLMKNLFAQESQFWPGVFRVAREYGFGQITDMGADTVLLWNESFFDQFCPLILADEVCQKGYLRLKEDQRAILRGALAIQANADCPECSSGIDLTDANFSIMLFAQTLLANCQQVGQTIFNATGSSPGQVSDYEDLWRFTLANYHAGPGCLSYAIHTAWARRLALTWENISTNFTQPCQGVLGYVELITK
jgi:hypothetical protein